MEHFKETQIFSMVRRSMSIRWQAVENLSASGKPFKFHSKLLEDFSRNLVESLGFYFAYETYPSPTFSLIGNEWKRIHG